ncbi:MAG: ABC transporter permease [Spirochaetaceae bacterium]|nr:MAG: ABC transporter permease [Spirochaetaceae bacterium]
MVFKRNQPDTLASGKLSLIRHATQHVLVSEYFVLILTIVYFLIVWAFVPWIGNRSNLMNILARVWPLLAAAVGQTFVLIVAGIDLSQVAVMAVTSVVGTSLITESVNPILFEGNPIWGVLITEQGGILAGHPAGVPIAIIVVLLIGMAIGLINGTAIAVFRMPAFVVTLVSMMFFGAFAIFLTYSENIMNIPAGYTGIAMERLGPISASLLISVLLAVVAYMILGRSILGRWMYAVGLNPRTARVSGVPTRGVLIFVYTFSGFCAAVAGILMTARLQVGRPVAGGLDTMLQIIGANVIGGMSLMGGKGKVQWTVFGVVFFVVLQNSVDQMNLDTFVVRIVLGFAILMAALLDVARNRMAGSLAQTPSPTVGAGT